MAFQLKRTCRSVATFSQWLFEDCAHQQRTREHLGLCVEARLHDGRRKTHQPAGKRLAHTRAEADAIRQRINRAHLNEWPDDVVRGRIGQVACAAIADAVALIVDDTGFEKKGTKSPGVQRQYTGTAGKITNCQVVVSTHLASHEASTPLEMDLYLPQSWCQDDERRAEAGIPASIRFRTKPAIALDQIDRVVERGGAPSLVLADAGYGDNTEFREGLRTRGLDYAVGISGTSTLWRPGEGPDAPAAYTGRGRRPTRRYPGTHQPVEARVLAEELPVDAWCSVDLRPDAPDNKRTSRFARIRVRHAHRAVQGREPGPEEWLVIEWPEGEAGPSHYFLSSLPDGAALSELAIMAKLRWRVERDYQDAKQEVGLDQYEGRRWRGLNHHLTICMASMAFLVASRSLSPPQPSAELGRRPAGATS